MKRFVVYSEEKGIYLGSCMGLGFWSKLDAVGQVAAVTFSGQESVDKFVKTVDDPKVFADVKLVEVDVPEHDKYYASIDECVKAGLPSWEHEVQRSDVALFEIERERKLAKIQKALSERITSGEI